MFFYNLEARLLNDYMCLSANIFNRPRTRSVTFGTICIISLSAAAKVHVSGVQIITLNMKQESISQVKVMSSNFKGNNLSFLLCLPSQ